MPKPDEAEETKDITSVGSIQSIVETAAAEDEIEDEPATDNDDLEDSAEDDSGENESKESESESEEESEEDESEEEKSEDEKKPAVERKFKNLADEEDAKYISNLEKAYENSSAEAIRLNTELSESKKASAQWDKVMTAVNANPELAKQLNAVLEGKEIDVPDKDPFLVSAKTEWETKSRQELEEIVAKHPEVISDPALNDRVKHWMTVFSKEAFETDKRMLTGGEAMTMALRHLGIDVDDTRPSMTSKAKEAAAPTRPKASRKSKPSARTVSNEAYKFGELMGVSKEQVEKFAN